MSYLQRQEREVANPDLNISLYIDGSLKYPAKSHARRVAEKLNMENGIIILAATKNVNWPNSDMPAPFRQDRYFYYLTGCREPDCYATYSIESDRLTLWLPPVDNDWRHVVYYGNGSTVEEALHKYDIDEAKYIKKEKKSSSKDRTGQANYQHCGRCDVDSGLLNIADQARNLYYGHRADRDLSTNSRTQIFTFGMGGDDEAKNRLRRAMDACRVIKDEYEIEMIRKANDISSAAHKNVLKGMHKFTNEAEIEAAYMQTCIARKAKEQAYDAIVGSGRNAAVLHYSENLANFGDGQTVVLDAGCEVECYASDITRTIPINEHKPGYWPSKESEAIYNLVEKVQESCIRRLLPGSKYIEITWHAHHLVIDGLLELGILTGDHDEIFHAGISRAFLPHGLGHHVGLEVHDVEPMPSTALRESNPQEELQRLREAYSTWRPQSASFVASLTSLQQFAISSTTHTTVDSIEAPALEPGMILTVEPGIYFNNFLLKRYLKDPETSKYIDEAVLQRYIPVGGVRIEDCVLVTEDGNENLTSAPKGAEMLNIIRKAAG